MIVKSWSCRDEINKIYNPFFGDFHFEIMGGVQQIPNVMGS